MGIERSIDRFMNAFGDEAVLPPAFQYRPSMLTSYYSGRGIAVEESTPKLLHSIP